MSKKQSALVIPFGKYRGKRLDDLMLADPAYVQWLMNQEWVRTNWPAILTTIVNGGLPAAAATPVHNRMQMRFRDPLVAIAAYRLIIGDQAVGDQARAHLTRKECYRDYREPGAQTAYEQGAATLAAEVAEAKHRAQQAGQRRSEVERAYWQEGATERGDLIQHRLDTYKKQERAADAQLETVKAQAEEAGRRAVAGWAETALDDALAKVGNSIGKNVRFERFGWDVLLKAPFGLPGVGVELKPALGDDYPEVLRKVQSRTERDLATNETIQARALIVDSFGAEGATWDDVVWMFGQNSIAAVLQANVMELAASMRRPPPPAITSSSGEF